MDLEQLHAMLQQQQIQIQALLQQQHDLLQRSRQTKNITTISSAPVSEPQVQKPNQFDGTKARLRGFINQIRLAFG